MNEEEWDFGFTSEDELKVEVSTKVNDKATAIRDMVMPLLNNLKRILIRI